MFNNINKISKIFEHGKELGLSKKDISKVLLSYNLVVKLGKCWKFFMIITKKYIIN